MRSLACWLMICGGLVGRVAADERPSAAVSEKPVADVAVKEAVARSLPFLERAGVSWMTERDCNSCHHVPFLIWSHRAAQSKGVAVDTRKLADWSEWARRDSLSRRNALKLTQYELKKLDSAMLLESVRVKLMPMFDQGFETEALFVARLSELLTADELQLHQEQLIKNATLGPHSPERTGGGVDVLGQLLRVDSNVANGPSIPEFRRKTMALMMADQLPGGAWVPGSQFASMRRWSSAAADQTTTMWAALALADSEGLDDPKSLERAIEYLKTQPEQSENNEWLAVRLLFSTAFDKAERSALWQQKVLAARAADGGWSWAKGNPSDPYTTGLSLYVLSKTGGASADVVHDARQFLLGTQQADGSWRTESKFISKTTDPERLKVRDEIYHYWGTGWVVVGLLETMPEPATSSP